SAAAAAPDRTRHRRRRGAGTDGHPEGAHSRPRRRVRPTPDAEPAARAQERGTVTRDPSLRVSIAIACVACLIANRAPRAAVRSGVRDSAVVAAAGTESDLAGPSPLAPRAAW